MPKHVILRKVFWKFFSSTKIYTHAYPPPGTFDDELPTPPLPMDVPFDPPKDVLNCGADIASKRKKSTIIL